MNPSSNSLVTHRARKMAKGGLVLGLLLGLNAHANIILNGDFEADTVSDPNAGSGYQYVQSADLTGWTVTDVSGPNRGAVLFNSTYGQGVGGGVNSLQLEDYGDAISQVIGTTIGQLYELSFDLSAYSSPGTATLSVGIGVDSFLFTGTSPAYVTHSLLFTASATSTTIRFTHIDGVGSDRYPHLDNISVNEVSSVPVPAGYALLLGGLALLRIRHSQRS
ncbi:MAG: DUF642 domain-containing protein [Gammaproteobacteria bacterium]|nr:DUF642 domain-containing protein [Gammaproteobacteria bacterium]MCP5137453.1 DUF642 domain-containing protein [Gammaproteobacteria bacterium]